MQPLRFLAMITLLLTTSMAADWPQFRGPFFNGSSDEQDLPTEFSRTENVKWSVDLPGPSAATPVISKDHVFVSSTDLDTDELVAMCFDRRTGKLNWKHSIAKGISQDTRSDYASPTPAADGQHVFFFYGNGDLVAFDYDGNKIWQRNIQKDYGDFAFQWTFSTSPLVYDGRLYMQVLQRDVAVRGKGVSDKRNLSYLLALNPADGKELWQHIRPSEARAESLEAFTTPMPFEADGRKEILIAGGDVITGHDPDSGEELWRWGTWNPGHRRKDWRLVPSPVAGGGVVLACAPKNDPIYAVSTGGNGDLSDDSLAWVSEDQPDLSSDVPTPAFYDGDFFILSDGRRTVARVEPATGKIKWKQSTPGRGKYEASPTVADGKVHLFNFDGDVVILSAESGEVLTNVSMDDPQRYNNRSSISVAAGNLFIRTTDQLFCIGK